MSWFAGADLIRIALIVAVPRGRFCHSDAGPQKSGDFCALLCEHEAEEDRP